MLTIAGFGIAIGAFISPYIVRILGRHLWIRLAMVVGTPSLLLYIAIPNQYTIGIAAFLLAMCGQAVKVTNDALVQSKISDEFRGRVFSFYDMVVNAAIVTGAFVAALVLPKSGVSRTLPMIIVSAFALTSVLLLRNANFRSLSTTS
jgi:predicted MFS family arabinose efflux permease